MLDRDTPLLEANGDRLLLGSCRERLPHLARAEPRIVELFDQRRDVLTAQAQDGQDRLPE